MCTLRYNEKKCSSRWTKSSQDEMEINAQTNDALHHVVSTFQHDQRNNKQHLHTERVELKAGNMMNDEFVPWPFKVTISASRVIVA